MADGEDDLCGANGSDGTGNGGGNSEPESSDSLKAFGEVVKAFRKRKGLTQEEFAPQVRYAPQTVASIEQGRRFPPQEFVERAEDVLDAFGALRGAARHLSRQPGLASWFRQWARLEAEAITLNTYECRLIPGLLQTEAYARTLFDEPAAAAGRRRRSRPSGRHGRSGKRLLMERPNTAYSFILEEHLFLRRTGGTAVTRELIDHVLEVAELRNVEIQFMPVVRESHAGLDGPIRLLETPENKWFGYCEGQETRPVRLRPESDQRASRCDMPGCARRLSPLLTP